MSKLETLAHSELIAGRYRIERSLGEGGMAAVYEALDETTGARVALKRLSDGHGPRVLELFEQEYRTLASLRHPGIVEVYEFGVVGAGAFYTMEVLQGGDLSRSAPLPWRQACAYLRDVASILGLLHARRLVHRDLSPRNLWRTNDGTIKLLDFGSLASFGATRDVVGTPPFIAPEALESHQVDQRTDLYALGALGYWFMTSVHAYRARRLAELPALWERPPLPPSALVQLLGATLPEVPSEVDRLIMALINLDPSARPASTVDVIDRLNGIAGLAPEAGALVTQGYLASKAFVGRDDARATVERSLAAAASGAPTAVLIEGPQGIGRSRFLQELTIIARIAGAKVMCIGRDAGTRPYAGSIALGLELMRSVPDDARSAARPYADGLAEVADELSAGLGMLRHGSVSADATNARARKQATLAGWILALSRLHTLAIMVDDIHELDEESQALLLTLIRSAAGHRICVVGAACSNQSAGAIADESSHALRALRTSAKREQLDGLSPDEMHELLLSLFGDVPYLGRLTARLHNVTKGNPEHCLLLARQLMDSGAVQYDAGSWILPQDLREADLSTSLHKGLLVRLDRLPPASRQFARCLSIPDHGALTLELAVAAGGLSQAETAPLLRALIEHGVLQVSAAAGYRFVHAEQRVRLYSELERAERARAHRAVAQRLERAAGADSMIVLRAGLHWLWAGDITNAEPLIFQASKAYASGTVAESLKQVAPMFADAVSLLRAAGRSDQAMLLPLSVLAYAGYFVDRRYALHYSAPAIEALSAALRLDVARRCRPVVGAKLAIVISMLQAGVILRFRSHTPRLAQLLYCLVSAATTSAGCFAIGLDAAAVRRYASVLEPLSALRSATVVRFLRRFNEALILIVEGDFAGGQAIFRELRAALEQPGQLAELPPETRQHYLAHVQALHGLYDAWACKTDSLDYANRTEAIGAFHSMWANQVRAIYWSFQGQRERAVHFERQVELQAIQIGSAWQVESWTSFSRLADLTFDAVSTKRAADELDRFSASLPAYAVYARWMRAAYCVLRGQYGAALDLYQGADGEPADLSIWPVARGWFAEALNATGQYAKARALCEDTLSRMTPDNIDIVYLSLRVEVQLALAESGLGQFDDARARLTTLSSKHVPFKGPLVQGYLHCARAQLEFAQGQLEAAREQLILAAAQYAPLQIPSLTEHIMALRSSYRDIESIDAVAVPQQHVLLTTDDHVLTRVQLLLHASGAEPTDRARKAVALALELTGADRGFALQSSGELVAMPDQPPDRVLAWARKQLQDTLEGDDTATAYVLAAEALATPCDSMEHDGVIYRLRQLWRPGTNDRSLCALLVLGNANAEELLLLRGELLRTIASGLIEI